MSLAKNDVIQIVPPHKWGGCLAVVDEVKSFGCQAYVSIPSNDGAPPAPAYIRLKHEDFEPLGVKAYYEAVIEKEDKAVSKITPERMLELLRGASWEKNTHIGAFGPNILETAEIDGIFSIAKLARLVNEAIEKEEAQ